ncbi:MAG: NYN domain-containing protein, partial [Clostridia bacterium]|nr:NYN domain-containing protein [Clostridia bacterium]
VTSDGLIQLQAVRSGVLRLSAREFRDEVLAVDEEIAAFLKKLREENKKSGAPKRNPGAGQNGQNGRKT